MFTRMLAWLRFACCVIACGLATGWPRPTVAQEHALPNIVLIVADDLGWADIGYNHAAVYSPHLDQLASEGVLFRQHYVTPQCTPTRVALMTGRYPSRFGGAAQQASNAPAFPQGTLTLARLLQQRGYATYLAGKWHLGSDPAHGPNAFGFQSSYGSFAGAVGMYDHRYRPGKFEQTWHRDHVLIEGAENGTHATDLVTREAVRVIEQKRDQPFFLYLPFHSVHTPLDERGPFVERPTQLDPDRPDRWLDEDEIPWFHDPDGKIQSERDPEKRLLLAAVHHFDHAVGEIVAALDQSGQRDNTLILFSSDNGPQGSWPGNAYPDDLKLTDFNQPLPFRGKKIDVWEGGIHVPAFANWPGELTPREINTPTHIVDWLPTLVALVDRRIQPQSDSPPQNGVDRLADLETDGQDLSPLMWGTGDLPPRELYWTWGSPPNRWALRSGEWKIVKYGRGTPQSPQDWELYHLANDPAEEANLAAEHPDRLSSLHQKFLQLRAKDRGQ